MRTRRPHLTRTTLCLVACCVVLPASAHADPPACGPDASRGAMLRDDIGDLSDVLLMVVTHLRSENDLTTFAEASMMPETEQLFRAYASLIERTTSSRIPAW